MGYGVRWCPNPPRVLAPSIEPSPTKGASKGAPTKAAGLQVRTTPVGRPGLVRVAATGLARIYRGGAHELDTRHRQSAGAQVGGILPQPLAARQHHTQHPWR